MSVARTHSVHGGVACICPDCGDPMYVESISGEGSVSRATWKCSTCEQASPVPLETMIEEMTKAGRKVLPEYAAARPSLEHAIESLHAAWKERND